MYASLYLVIVACFEQLYKVVLSLVKIKVNVLYVFECTNKPC